MPWPCCCSTSWASSASTRCMRLQALLPFNPPGMAAVEREPRLQHGGELRHQHQLAVLRAARATMSYLVQMAGLTVHNFVSAATGIALALALVRGFARRSAKSIGNFWVDLTRCTLYVLLPLSIVVGAVLRLAGRAAEPRRLHRRDHARRRQADDRPGAGGLAGSHQDAGHQRRRLLQRQLGPSVREPQRRSPTSCRSC